jgi:hypothetical protein
VSDRREDLRRACIGFFESNQRANDELFQPPEYLLVLGMCRCGRHQSLDLTTAALDAH